MKVEWKKTKYKNQERYELFINDILTGEFSFDFVSNDQKILLEAFEISSELRGFGFSKILALKINELLKTKYIDYILVIECVPYNDKPLSEAKLASMYQKLFPGCIEVSKHLFHYMA